MPPRQSLRITTRSVQFCAVPSSALTAGESALPASASWRIIERLLIYPVELSELTAFTLAIRPFGGKSATRIDTRQLQHAFASGSWSLISRPRSASGPVIPKIEPVAEQIRSAKIVKTWVEMEVVDEQGRPMPNQAYLCMLPDGVIRQGETDSQGRVRFHGIEPGNRAFSLTKLSPERWRRG